MMRPGSWPPSYYPSGNMKGVAPKLLSSQNLCRSTELKVVFDSLVENHKVHYLYLPCEATAILDHKEQLSDFLQNSSFLETFLLKSPLDFFTEEQQKEMDEIIARSLLVNHSLNSTDLADYGNASIRHLLNLNFEGVIAAAAGKGVPLPLSFVKGMPDSAVPEALKKVGEKGGLTGTFSFLQQIHFGNLVTENIGNSEWKKRSVDLGMSNYVIC